MQTHLRGRDLITLQEWTKEEIDTALEVAFELKRQRALGQPHAILRDKVLAMLFFYSSTRTRASFEAGMAQLGGHAQFIESRTTQIAHGDTAKEIGEILGDILTIIEKKGHPRGKTITVSWAYAASYQKPISVPQSLILLMPRFGVNVRLVHPPGFQLMPEIVEQAKENARRARAGFEVMDDFDAGMRGTDVVYAKSWGPLLTVKTDA